MLKYNPPELWKALNHLESKLVIPTLKKYNVNPKTITEIVVMESLTVLEISNRYYVTTGLSSGYNGAGPSALNDLLTWCGCKDKDVFDAIKTQKIVHFANTPIHGNSKIKTWHLLKLPM